MIVAEKGKRRQFLVSSIKIYDSQSFAIGRYVSNLHFMIKNSKFNAKNRKKEKEMYGRFHPEISICSGFESIVTLSLH